MNMKIKDAYRNRINCAIDTANYFSDANSQIDKSNLRFNNDQLVESMAEYLNNISMCMNENFSINPQRTSDAWLIKKSIFNLITVLTGASMATGNGMNIDKFKWLLKEAYSELDPTDTIE